VLLFAADAMSAAAQLCDTLAERVQQQRKQQQQRQQPPERQQQQQQRGQLPPDQQVELDNSLNSLALSALHMWLLLFGALAAAPLGTGRASSGAAAAAAAAAGAAAGFSSALVELGYEYEQVASYAVQALKFWPAPQADTSAESSTPSSSSSSNKRVVRYANVALPYLPVVDVTHMLPAALALAQTLSIALDAVQQYASMPMDQVVQQQGQNAKMFCDMVQLTRAWLAQPSVLELQLLLLACQAKVCHQQLAVTQQGLSAVHALSKDSWQQQQQQGQALGQQQRRRLKLPAAHDQLLDKYGLLKADLAQLQQQHTAGPPHIRYGMTLLT
jgi:hypothetical protein